MKDLIKCGHGMICWWLALLVFAGTTQAQPDYTNALWNQAYTNHWYTGGCCHSFCVIHDMEGYYEDTISYFQQAMQGNNYASVFYCVNSLQNGSDTKGHAENNPGDAAIGEITQMVREKYWAWHAVCWNEYMFGTEHEGFVNTPAWYSEGMYQASAGLQRHLCQTYGIPIDRQHIIGHNEHLNSAWTGWMATNWPEIDTTCNDHTDPGQYWNWSHFMLLVANGMPMITNQPFALTVAQSSNATMTMKVTGTAPLTYHWQFNHTNISGTTSTNYTITNAQTTSAGKYYLIASNALGSATSCPVLVSVVAQLTNGTTSTLAPTNMVNWWPAEGNANDIFSTNHGIAVNGVTYVPGKVGIAFHFDGNGSYVNLRNTNSLPPPWTASLWVNRQNAPGSSAGLLSDSVYSLKLEQYNGTRKVGLTKFGVGDYTFTYSAPVNTWVHLAFVGTTNGTALYANGVSQGSLTNVIPLPRLLLGGDASGLSYSDFMLGNVDEVMIFNRALSTVEISAIVNAGTAGLVKAPQFSFTTRPHAGQTGLTLKGQTGKSFTIYSSTNMKTWTSIGTLQNPKGTNTFIDTAATNKVKYYRASQP